MAKGAAASKAAAMKVLPSRDAGQGMKKPSQAVVAAVKTTAKAGKVMKKPSKAVAAAVKTKAKAGRPSKAVAAGAVKAMEKPSMAAAKAKATPPPVLQSRQEAFEAFQRQFESFMAAAEPIEGADYAYFETGLWLPSGQGNSDNRQMEFWRYDGTKETFLTDEVDLPRPPATRPSRSHRPVYELKVGIFHDEDCDAVSIGRMVNAAFKRWMAPDQFSRLRRFELRTSSRKSYKRVDA